MNLIQMKKIDMLFIVKELNKKEGVEMSLSNEEISLLEKNEDEKDAEVAEEAYVEYLNSGRKSAPISTLWKELDQ